MSLLDKPFSDYSDEEFNLAEFMLFSIDEVKGVLIQIDYEDFLDLESLRTENRIKVIVPNPCGCGSLKIKDIHGSNLRAIMKNLVSFIEPPIVKTSAFREFWEECEINGIETEYNECCVCREFSDVTTPCKHSLCLVCYNKLNQPSCPMCRQSLEKQCHRC